MATNDYHFITHWRVRGTVYEVADILGNAEELPLWWPSVYLNVCELAPGDAHGVGKEVDLYTKGWLPYTLRWQFRVTKANYPYGFALEARGDFVGRGIWTFEQRGAWVNITYDWKIRADKGLLRYASFIFKPIFAANHRWAMAQGEKSLKLELARRRASTFEEQTLLHRPPQPTTTSGVVLAGAGGMALALVASLAVVIVIGWRAQTSQQGKLL